MSVFLMMEMTSSKNRNDFLGSVTLVHERNALFFKSITKRSAITGETGEPIAKLSFFNSTMEEMICVRVTLSAAQSPKHTAWLSEIGSLRSLDVCNSGASNDVIEPILVHQAVQLCAFYLNLCAGRLSR